MADLYILAIALGVLPGLQVAVTRRPLPPWEPFVMFGSLLLVALVYHLGLSRRTTFRSPGEIMLGRVRVDGRKEWRNPYSVGRGLLFAVLFPTLILAGNSWDSAADDRLYSTLTLPVVLGRAALLAALLVGTVRAGAGHVTAGWLIVAYFGIFALSAFGVGGSGSVPAEAARTIGWAFAGAALVTTLILLYYRRHPRRDEVQEAVT